MKRWLVWLVLPLLTCIAIIAARAQSGYIFEDSDTIGILSAIRARNAPLSWFHTDWPLANHFYRPISTLTFELNERLTPGNAQAFGLTNALLACACVLLLFWLVRETTESPWLAGLSSALFGAWHVLAFVPDLINGACWFLAVACLAGFLRGGLKSVPNVALAFLTLAFATLIIVPVPPAFGVRIIPWMPGRTASVMAVFALVSLASYARYERLSAKSLERAEPTATDVPATKGSEAATTTGTKSAWIWVVWSILTLALALGSYEQAVVVPGALLGVAVLFRTQRRIPRWWLQIAFWSVLALYLVVRHQFVPSAASNYQLQQFRNGPGVLIPIADYFLPAWNYFETLKVILASGPLMFLMVDPWMQLVYVAGNVAASFQIIKSKSKWQILAYLLIAGLVFLPMAWMQPFGHYHYLSSAFRAVFAVSLLSIALKAFATAVSLPSLQAPKRLHPAPGSLHRQ